MKLIFVFLLFYINSIFAQKETFYADLIDSGLIKKHVEMLASDFFEGRETGEKGQKKTAQYVASQFRLFGLDSLSNQYSQPFSLFKKSKSGILSFNGILLKFPEDFGFHGFYNDKRIEYTTIKAMNWEKFKQEKFNSMNPVIVTINSYYDVDFELVKSKGIQAVFFICKNYNPTFFTKYTEGQLTFLNKNKQHIFFINRKKLQGKQKREVNSITIEIEPLEEVTTENIIAYIEGSDSILKNEFAVISAHYDHLGVKNGVVYNGADDNASGTAALIELAHIFQEAKKRGENPKRSILFICFTAEEEGLLGSEYYTLNPLVPLQKTISNFNIDMIGRKNPRNERDQFSVYIIGSNRISMDFHHKQAEIAKKYSSLKLDYIYNDPNNKEKLYYRSDHYNFAKYGIPSIFYFGGFHEDYHKPTDDIEKLNFTKIKEIAKLVFYTAWVFAN